MEVVLDIGDGILLLYESRTPDWSQFYLRCDGLDLHLGAEAISRVRKRIQHPWRESEEGKSLFWLNFFETHCTLYMRRRGDGYAIHVRNRDGEYLFYREAQGVCRVAQG